MTDFDRDHTRATTACSLYLLGALDHAAEAAFERHLAGCASCQRECDRLGPVVSGLGQLGADEVGSPTDQGT